MSMKRPGPPVVWEARRPSLAAPSPPVRRARRDLWTTTGCRTSTAGRAGAFYDRLRHRPEPRRHRHPPLRRGPRAGGGMLGRRPTERTVDLANGVPSAPPNVPPAGHSSAPTSSPSPRASAFARPTHRIAPGAPECRSRRRRHGPRPPADAGHITSPPGAHDRRLRGPGSNVGGGALCRQRPRHAAGQPACPGPPATSPTSGGPAIGLPLARPRWAADLRFAFSDRMGFTNTLTRCWAPPTMS